MDKIIDRILEISSTHEGKDITQMTLKCGEEFGELSQAVLSYTKAPACAYKMKTLDDVGEEIADVFIVTVAIAAKAGISKEELKAHIENKLSRWMIKINAEK